MEDELFEEELYEYDLIDMMEENLYEFDLFELLEEDDLILSDRSRTELENNKDCVDAITRLNSKNI